jgi:hypothetical protein
MSGRRQAAGDRAFAYNPWTRIGVFRHVCRYHAKAYYTTCWTSYTGDPPNVIGLSEVVRKIRGCVPDVSGNLVDSLYGVDGVISVLLRALHV